MSNIWNGTLHHSRTTVRVCDHSDGPLAFINANVAYWSY